MEENFRRGTESAPPPPCMDRVKVILESGDLETNAYNSKTIWCILIL